MRKEMLKGVLSPDLLQQLYASLGSGHKPHAAILEAVWNSLEADADNIQIRVEGKGFDQIVTIIDDGFGANAEGRTALVSIGVSVFGKLVKGRNKFGTGVRVSWATWKKFEFITRSQESPPPDDRAYAVLIPDTEAASRELIAGKFSTELKVVDPPPVLGPGTGMVIRLSQPKRKDPVDPQKLAEFLAESLPTGEADKVTVNGQPLPPRTLVGNTIRRVIVEKPVVGDFGPITFELYIPKRRSEHDALWVWDQGRVCPLGDLIRELPHLQNRINRQVWLNPALCGMIQLPAWGQFASPSRSGFDWQALADNTAAMNALAKAMLTVEADVQTELITGSDTSVEERFDSVVSTLRQMAEKQSAWSQTLPEVVIDKPAVPKIEQLTVSPKTITLYCDNMHRFKISTCKPGTDVTKVVWEFPEHAGSLDQLTGGIVNLAIYDKPGNYRLIARYPDTNEQAEALVRVRASQDFRIDPESIRVEPGNEVIFTTQNGSGADVEWDIDPQGGTILTKDKKHLVWQAPDHVGLFNVRALQKGAQPAQALANVTVAREDTPICVRNHFLWVKLANFPGAPDVAVQLVQGDPKATPPIHTVLINQCGLGFISGEQAGEKALLQYVLQCLFLEIGVLEGNEWNPEEVIRQLGLMYVELQSKK